MSTLRKTMNELTKKLAFRYTRFGAPHYQYMVTPIQLAEIVFNIDKGTAGKSEGAIAEIGVARGMTSRFICEHLESKEAIFEFYCIDTFCSFTEGDINYEVDNRNKTKAEISGFFKYNNFGAWKRNFARYDFVKAIKCDASQFDFSTIAPIHFCFLDLDLYLPTINVLNNIYPHMSAGSVIMVDDVMDKNRWDGAYQAFSEFVESHELNYKVVGQKGGIIYI